MRVVRLRPIADMRGSLHDCSVNAISSKDPRRLAAWLVIGVLTLPLGCAWFTLRRGYSGHVRAGAFLSLGRGLVIAGTTMRGLGARHPPARCDHWLPTPDRAPPPGIRPRSPARGMADTNGG